MEDIRKEKIKNEKIHRQQKYQENAVGHPPVQATVPTSLSGRSQMLM